MRVVAVLTMAVAGSLLAASPGTSATPDTAVGASAKTESVHIQDVQPATYLIKELGRPGYCMQPELNKQLSEGPLVGMVPCVDGNSHQQWAFQTIEGVATWRAVVNVGNRGCLDADRKGNRLTKVVHVIPCNVRGNGSQWWQFPEPPGVGVVCSAMRFCTASDALVLDDSSDNGGGFGFRVNLWQPTGSDKQNFFLEGVA